MYTAQLDGVQGKGYTETPDLPGGKATDRVTYLCQIVNSGEFYDSVTETGASLGKTFKMLVKVEQASSGATAQQGVDYGIRITKFEVRDNADLAKQAHTRAAQKLRELIAAVSGYSETQLDSSPGAWQTLQKAFLSGAMTQRYVMVTVQSKTSRTGHAYNKHWFTPYVPPQQ